MRFRLLKWDVEISCGFSYWGNEPTSLKASWGFGIDIDLHNEHKQQYNYDLTQLLTPEMAGHWVALAPLNKSVLDHDLILTDLAERIKAKGLNATYMRYNPEPQIHLH